MPPNTPEQLVPLTAAPETPLIPTQAAAQRVNQAGMLASQGGMNGGTLLESAVNVGKSALVIGGIATVIVAGIRTLFGEPPKLVKAIVPGL